MDNMIEQDGMDFNCPICDKKISTEAGGTRDLCEHVLFVYLDAVGEFESATDEIDNLIEQIEAENSDKDDYYDGNILEDLSNRLPKTVTIYKLNGSGMSCGPCHATVSIGIKEEEIGEEIV